MEHPSTWDMMKDDLRERAEKSRLRDELRDRMSGVTADAGDGLVERLRQYNPPDRTIDKQRQISVDIHEAADAIVALQRQLERAQGAEADLAKTLLRAEKAEAELAGYELALIAARTANAKLRDELKLAQQWRTGYEQATERVEEYRLYIDAAEPAFAVLHDRIAELEKESVRILHACPYCHQHGGGVTPCVLHGGGQQTKVEKLPDGMFQFVCPACGIESDKVRSLHARLAEMEKHSEMLKDFLFTIVDSLLPSAEQWKAIQQVSKQLRAAIDAAKEGK